MKKTLFVSLAVCLAANLQAQESDGDLKKQFYVRAGGGYGFSHAGEVLGSTQHNTSKSSGSTTLENTQTYELKKGSYGAGINGVAAAGFIPHRHFGAELAVGIGIRHKRYTREQRFVSTGTFPHNNATYSGKSTAYLVLPVLVMPSVLMQTGGSRMNVYTRMGLALPVAGKILMKSIITEQHQGITNTYESAYELTTRFSVGLQGALGLHLALSDRFSVYMEANALSMNAYARKSRLTQYLVNGFDQLPASNVYGRETEYESDFTVDGNADPNAPAKQQTYSLPFSNIGLGAGVLFRF